MISLLAGVNKKGFQLMGFQKEKKKVGFPCVITIVCECDCEYVFSCQCIMYLYDCGKVAQCADLNFVLNHMWPRV